MKMSNFELAIDDYKSLLDIRPNNTVVQKEMELARRGLADMKQREKSMFYMMFDKVRLSLSSISRDKIFFHRA